MRNQFHRWLVLAAPLAMPALIALITGIACCSSANGSGCLPPVTPSGTALPAGPTDTPGPTDILLDPTITMSATPAPGGTTPAPVITPPAPTLSVSMSPPSINAGGQMTLSARADGFNIATYLITLSTGGRITATTGNQTNVEQPDTLFDVVSVTGMTGGVDVVLLAREAGTSTITVSASGEVGGVADGTPYLTTANVSAPPVDVTVAVRPHIVLSASQTALRVGDEVTLTGKSVGIGLEIFTITLSTGGRWVVTYENKPGKATPDPLFELVSLKGMNGGVEAVLRAVKPGKTTVAISATGEISLGGPGATAAWAWGGGGSEPLDLTIAE